eukprot:scaffold1145_cov66-Phaeocystis_antarctica.AAC.2
MRAAHRSQPWNRCGACSGTKPLRPSVHPAWRRPRSVPQQRRADCHWREQQSPCASRTRSARRQGSRALFLLRGVSHGSAVDNYSPYRASPLQERPPPIGRRVHWYYIVWNTGTRIATGRQHHVRPSDPRAK